MKYSEFRGKLGKLTVPTGQLQDELIEGEDSIHFIIVVGKLDGYDYGMIDESPYMDIVIGAINTLDLRGAKRDEDYIVTGNVVGNTIQIGLHSTHKFLSDEDFDFHIPRYKTE